MITESGYCRLQHLCIGGVCRCSIAVFASTQTRYESGGKIALRECAVLDRRPGDRLLKQKEVMPL